MAQKRRVFSPASLAWPGARSRLSLRPPARKREREKRKDRRKKTDERTQRRKTTEDRRQQRFVFSQMSSSYWGCMRHDAFFWPRQAPTRKSSRNKKRRARVFFSFRAPRASSSRPGSSSARYQTAESRPSRTAARAAAGTTPKSARKRVLFFEALLSRGLSRACLGKFSGVLVV